MAWIGARFRGTDMRSVAPSFRVRREITEFGLSTKRHPVEGPEEQHRRYSGQSVRSPGHGEADIA